MEIPIGSDVTTVTIPLGKTLVIEGEGSINCKGNVTFVNNGNLNLSLGAKIEVEGPSGTVTVENHGTINNSGTIEGALKNEGD